MATIPPTKKTSPTTRKTPKKTAKQSPTTIKKPSSTTRKTPKNANLQVHIPTAPQTPDTSLNKKQTNKQPAKPSAKTTVTPYSPTTHKLIETATRFAHFPILTDTMTLHEAIAKTPKLRKDFLLSNFNELLIFSRGFEEHCGHIQVVMGMLNRHGLKTDFVRVKIGIEKLEGVGFCLGELGKGVDEWIREGGDILSEEVLKGVEQKK